MTELHIVPSTGYLSTYGTYSTPQVGWTDRRLRLRLRRTANQSYASMRQVPVRHRNRKTRGKACRFPAHRRSRAQDDKGCLMNLRDDRNKWSLEIVAFKYLNRLRKKESCAQYSSMGHGQLEI